jgi:hypothetical protein
MARALSLSDLWHSARSGEGAFPPAALSRLPEPARRYLEHAIAPGTRLARAVRLRMRGEIKLKRWLPFSAEEVIAWDRGMIWSAAVRMAGLAIRGSDRLVGGEGAMRWRLLGIIPVMAASGPDITRSAAGRMAGESVWLCGDEVSWEAPDPSQAIARLTVAGEPAEVSLGIDAVGRLETVRFPRWGNPEGGAFRRVDFGGVVEEERRFAGYTIPMRLRLGWYFGSARFDAEGEFFRVQIEEALYR